MERTLRKYLELSTSVWCSLSRCPSPIQSPIPTHFHPFSPIPVNPIPFSLPPSIPAPPRLSLATERYASRVLFRSTAASPPK
ncbi:hypothetical protein E2C01_087633 [Portunus trituberculatus]|uniref:Uncharacterized protein n=1 Tax=Portunus trituberculatus TaxID=210409 RepID=A0A5B7J740_PORTR|nr:hypothetical protein [Portunus trituberculatus]